MPKAVLVAVLPQVEIVDQGDNDGVNSIRARLDSVGLTAVQTIVYPQQDAKALVAANFTGTVTRFTIAGGPIRILTLGMLITTALPSGANTLLFSTTPTGGVAANLCGATDTASAALNQLFVVDGVKGTGLVKTTDPGIMVAANQHMPVVVAPGVIQTIFSAGPPATGAGIIFIEWTPVYPGATVS